jgi:hypothetical protein
MAGIERKIIFTLEYKKKTTFLGCLLKYKTLLFFNYAILAIIELNVSLGRIALLNSSGVG